jgi:hypothetical protein
MAFHRKLHFAIGLREQRVIAATANVLTRMELSASLTNDDVPRKNLLTAKFFSHPVVWTLNRDRCEYYRLLFYVP